MRALFACAKVTDNTAAYADNLFTKTASENGLKIYDWQRWQLGHTCTICNSFFYLWHIFCFFVTWNVRTMRTDGKIEILQGEMKRLGVSGLEYAKPDGLALASLLRMKATRSYIVADPNISMVWQ